MEENNPDIDGAQKRKRPMTIQAHWVYGIVAFAELILAMAIMGLFIIIAPFLTDNSILTTSEIVAICITFGIIIFAVFTRGLFQWKFTYYVITKHKVYMVKLGRGLSFIFQEAVFDLVKSIEERKPGILASLLNYGHISLNTDDISSHSVFYMKFIKDSEKVAKHIEGLILKKNA